MEHHDRNSRKRAYHWLIIVIAWIFLFLLLLESVAYIIIGAWHLSIPRLENVRLFSAEIYRRELGFGILLVILGSFGLFICLIGLVATIFLRLIFLRLFAFCLWMMMTLGFAIGIIGIVFGTQIDNFLDADPKRNPNLIEQHYYNEKFLLLMNGSLTLFMSLTLIVGLVIVCCLSSAIDYHSYTRAK